ncbi:MAG: hypothetical protein IPK08_16250 [Bacteroidetes bacterium]|nr:hypothetical protein [Bacteroidota bacterium]
MAKPKTLNSKTIRKRLTMLRNNFKYWTIVILLSYGSTVGIHLIVRPMWFNGSDSVTSATIIEGLITMLFFANLFGRDKLHCCKETQKDKLAIFF